MVLFGKALGVGGECCSFGRFQGQKPSGPAAPWIFGLVTPKGQHSPLFSTLPLFQRIYHVFHFIATLSLYCAQQKKKNTFTSAKPLDVLVVGFAEFPL